MQVFTGQNGCSNEFVFPVRKRGRPTKCETEFFACSSSSDSTTKKTKTARTRKGRVWSRENVSDEPSLEDTDSAFVFENLGTEASDEEDLEGGHAARNRAEANAWEKTRQQRFIEHLEREVFAGSVTCSYCGVENLEEPYACYTCDPLARACESCHKSRHDGFLFRHRACKWNAKLLEFDSLVSSSATCVRYPSQCGTCHSANITAQETKTRSVKYYGIECGIATVKIGSVQCNTCSSVTWLKPSAAHCMPTSPTKESGWISEDVLLLAHHLLLQTPALAVEGIVSAFTSYFRERSVNTDSQSMDPRSFRTALKEFRILKRELVIYLCLI